MVGHQMTYQAEAANSLAVKTGAPVGVVGMIYAADWPTILQAANFTVVVISAAVGIVTLAEKVRRWNRDTREEHEHEEHDRETRRIQRATLRALGVPVDTDPCPLTPSEIHAESLTRFEDTYQHDQQHHEGK